MRNRGSLPKNVVRQGFGSALCQTDRLSRACRVRPAAGFRLHARHPGGRFSIDKGCSPRGLGVLNLMLKKSALLVAVASSAGFPYFLSSKPTEPSAQSTAAAYSPAAGAQ